MPQDLIVKGRLTGPRSAKLDEPVDDITSEVEVIVHSRRPSKSQALVEFLDSLPPGTRSKEDIDRQIREERDSWGNR